MGIIKGISFALVSASLLVGCASQSDQAEVPRRDAADAGAPKAGAVSKELAALGISAEHSEEKRDYTALLGVEQVSSIATDQNYAFADVEGVHPCQRDEVLTEDCREISAKLAEELAREPTGSNRSALSELQALTPDVVNPESFDPAVTASELGRVPLPQSQAAQSLGFQLLQPPVAPPVEPEPEENTDPVLGEIPPFPVVTGGN